MKNKLLNKKPNLLFYISDHFRKDALHHMGNEAARTPNFDNILEDNAVSFSNAFCQNPVCVPSRCSFLSGRYPHVNGFRTMHHLQGPEDTNILKTLKQNGYHIYFGGKNDVFRADVPLNMYCDYRSDAYKEMDCLANGNRLPEGYTYILGKYSVQEALEAKAVKESFRQGKDSKFYYSIYQGMMPKDNPLSVGYVGAEDAQIEDAINYIRNYRGEQPLCVYLSLVLPHPQYTAFEEDYANIERARVTPAIRLTDEELEKKPSILKGIRRNHRLFKWSDKELLDFKVTYNAMIGHVDMNFGKLVGCLKEKEMYDDTAIVAFSDHGDYAGDFEITEINANTFEDFLTNVPLIIRPQKGIDISGGIRDGLVELVDIPKTIAELTGIALTEDDCGRSLTHLFRENEEHRDIVIAEGGRLAHEIQCMDGNHSEDNLYWARTSEQMKMPQHTKAVMVRNKQYKYVYRLYESDEFYDLTTDPHERDNQIDNARYASVINELKLKLLDKFVESCDVVPKRIDKRI